MPWPYDAHGRIRDIKKKEEEEEAAASSMIRTRTYTRTHRSVGVPIVK